MDKRIRKMYFRDCTVILISMILLWVIFSFFIVIASSIASNVTIKITVVSIGILVASYATLTLSAVLIHLGKNRTQLYTEDIMRLNDAGEDR